MHDIVFVKPDYLMVQIRKFRLFRKKKRKENDIQWSWLNMIIIKFYAVCSKTVWQLGERNVKELFHVYMRREGIARRIPRKDSCENLLTTTNSLGRKINSDHLLDNCSVNLIYYVQCIYHFFLGIKFRRQKTKLAVKDMLLF